MAEPIAIAAPAAPVPPPDGRILHGLKEMPGWVVVSGALVFFTAIWIYSHDDFIPRILDALIGAFLGLVVSNRPRPTNVQTDALSAGSMDQAVINTDSINVEKPKGE